MDNYVHTLAIKLHIDSIIQQVFVFEHIDTFYLSNRALLVIAKCLFIVIKMANFGCNYEICGTVAYDTHSFIYAQDKIICIIFKNC